MIYYKSKNWLIYIIVVLCWTYAFWIPAAIISNVRQGWQGIFVLHLMGGIGPLLTAAFIVKKTGKWKDYLGRVVKVKGFSPYLWIVIISPILVAVIAGFIIYGKPMISQDFLSFGILYALALLFFGPIPEELGWRGILFHELNKLSLLKAQVITAAIWLVWHIPLFFIVGSYQHGVGFFTSRFWLWTVVLLLQSFIMGYLYVLSNGSIASAILFHYFINLAGEALEKNFQFELVSILLYLALAIVTGLVCTSFLRRRINSDTG